MVILYPYAMASEHARPSLWSGCSTSQRKRRFAATGSQGLALAGLRQPPLDESDG